MAYRSERFPAGDMPGLLQARFAIDGLEESGLPLVTEVMSGKSYRRQLHPDTAAEIGDVNYVMQAVFDVPKRDDGMRLTARYFVEDSRRILRGLDLPGEPVLDEGGLGGLDPSTTSLGFGSTGTSEKDILHIYAPWISTRWTDAGKKCMFFCGIAPPKPKAIMEEHPVRWDDWSLRHGKVVFKPTPEALKTY